MMMTATFPFPRTLLGEQLADRPTHPVRSWPIPTLWQFWKRTTITDVKLRRALRPREVQVLNPPPPTWGNWYVCPLARNEGSISIWNPSFDSSYTYKILEWFCFCYSNGTKNSLLWHKPTPNSVCSNTTVAEMFVSRISFKNNDELWLKPLESDSPW
jgi:hypothetical protein